jgi:hypothetical protein
MEDFIQLSEALRRLPSIIHMVVEDISILVVNPPLVELLRQDARLEIFHQERQAGVE